MLSFLAILLMPSYPIEWQRIEASAPRVEIISSASAVTNIVADYETVTYSGSSWREVVDFTLTPAGSGDATITSLTPAIATVDANGIASCLSAGRLIVRATVGRKEIISAASLNKQDASIKTVPTKYVGGLSKDANDSIEAMVSGKTSSSSTRAAFSLYGSDTLPFERNTNLWCSSVAQALTCLSPWNSIGGRQRAGVLVTPRHIVLASHWNAPMYVGNKLCFVTTDNLSIVRTVVSITNTSSSGFVPNDISVALLNADLPDSISPVKILPATAVLTNKMPSLSTGLGVSCIGFDHGGEAAVYELASINLGSWSWLSNKHLSYSWSTNWSHKLIVGSSGQPCFMVAGANVALTTIWTGGGAGAGTFYGDYVSVINAAIAALDIAAGQQTGYTCSVIDLSGFPTYP